MSMGLLVNEENAVVWRGLMVMSAIEKLLFGVHWGPLNYLIIDLPPGTGAVLVTTPQEVAKDDVDRAANMFRIVGIKILGLVCNMSSFVCTHCGHTTAIFGDNKAESFANKHGVGNSPCLIMCDQKALVFKIEAQCHASQARSALLKLPHKTIRTPVFMPVATKGSLKGLLPKQIQSVGCDLILSNTYHLGIQPGASLLSKAGGLHKFMGWPGALLTDSGGFQMVSLLKLIQVSEIGVNFSSPYDGSMCLLRPEDSISIQHAIGADIIMQLDDVVPALTTGPRVKEAMERSIRWCDRCVQAHCQTETQSLFPIIQGGLDSSLRKQCIRQLVQQKVNGFAIGGLSGGEKKDDFWRMVHLSTTNLPEDKPRYLMGVGVPEDLVVCVALGVDMFDCVFPTRTAMNLMKRIQTAIGRGQFPQFVSEYMKKRFLQKPIPQWIKDALQTVNISV